eukprot:scaffold1267_cov171-Amphora_coffeaeformis.AAC.17
MSFSSARDLPLGDWYYCPLAPIPTTLLRLKCRRSANFSTMAESIAELLNKRLPQDDAQDSQRLIISPTINYGRLYYHRRHTLWYSTILRNGIG